MLLFDCGHMLRWHSKGGASVDSIPTPAGILFITHAPAILYVVSKKCLITKYKVSHVRLKVLVIPACFHDTSLLPYVSDYGAKEDG
jgi:hypothetical protein